MATKDFTLESVKKFILENGGRVTNHELVTRFKSHLNDQNLKGVNREKFKDFVNTLATIKVDERGEKVLVLKKKYRPEYETTGTQDIRADTRAMSEPPDKKPSASKNLDNVDGGGISKVRSEGNINTRESSESLSLRESTSTLSISSVASSNSLESQLEDDPNASIMSVKEKVQHLNRMTSETEIQAATSTTQKRKDPRFSHNKDGDDDDSHSSGSGYVTLEPEEKEWLVTCSGSDYHPMAKILSKNSSLAKLRDFTNTALHWAAKHGKPEVVKLIAGHLKPAEFNRRTGGYTPLHLAAMQGHEDIIQLLVQTYKVDSNVRDYSGKKAKQYLKNSASSKAQQLLLTRRLGSTMTSSRSLDDSFTRTSSFRKSNRARAISSLIQTTSSGMRKAMLRTSWAGSTEDMNGDRATTPRSTPSPNNTPPGSAGTSPAAVRRGQTFAGRDKELMPPPSAPIRRSKKTGASKSKDSLVENDVKSNKMEQRCISEPNLLPQPSKMTYI